VYPKAGRLTEVDGVNRCAVIPWIRHANREGTLFDVVVQSRCSDESMQWSPTNGLREVVVHVMKRT
jgi:hypothetical protein